MKRILSISIFILLVALPVGLAVALFSGKVFVSGIGFSTGDARLLISEDGENFLPKIADFSFSDLKRGQTVTQNIFLKNVSAAPIALTISLSPKNVSGDLDEDDLLVKVKVLEDGVFRGAGDFLSLAEIDGAPLLFPGDAILHGDTREYQLIFKLSESADEQNADINFDLDILGEQKI